MCSLVILWNVFFCLTVECGLVNNLGTGMKDFFYEPAQGIMKSPHEFAKGMQKGSLSLFQVCQYICRSRLCV